MAQPHSLPTVTDLHLFPHTSCAMNYHEPLYCFQISKDLIGFYDTVYDRGVQETVTDKKEVAATVLKVFHESVSSLNPKCVLHSMLRVIYSGYCAIPDILIYIMMMSLYYIVISPNDFFLNKKLAYPGKETLFRLLSVSF